MPRVTILQEYVPEYRAKFFTILRERGKAIGIDIEVAHGRPGGAQADRSDACILEFAVIFQQYELNLFGKRLVIRRAGRSIRDADAIILEQARRNIDAYFWLARRSPRKPIIGLWGHGKDYTQRSSMLSAALARWLTRRADWFFAYTRGGALAVAGNGYPPDRITVVQNTIDTSALREDLSQVKPEDTERFRQRLGLTGSTAVFLGGLDETKRIAFLLQSADRVYAVDRNFRLLIVGTGRLRQEVEAWTAERPWAAATGPLAGREKALALSAGKFMLIPGRVGLAAIDSLTAGLPIITTAWPWHAPEFEYLAPGSTAVVTEDSLESYASGILKLMANPTALSEMQNNCLAAAEKYTLDAMVENYLEGISEMLQGVHR